VLSEKELLFASVQVTTPFAGSNIFTSSSFLSAPADSTIDGNLGEKGQGNSMQQSNFTYTLPWRNYIENKKGGESMNLPVMKCASFDTR
jgi:hypothetical protein